MGLKGRCQVPPESTPALQEDVSFPRTIRGEICISWIKGPGQGVSRICREHCEASSAPACLCVPLQLVVVAIVLGLASGMRKEV